tara:strand:- start:2848 stop:4560 length:1713 start_codon:yes stop_codon:yes gene_type:complete
MAEDLIVRFAGEGGQGVVTASEGLSQAAAQVGYHVQTFSTFPSQIKGGPTLGQTRVSTLPILSSGDGLHVLVALDEYAYENNKEDLFADGIIVYNSKEFTLDLPNAIGFNVDELARSTGNPLSANMVMIGAVAGLANMPAEYFTEFITKRFDRGRDNDKDIIDANIKALELGMDAVKESTQTLPELDAPSKISEERVLIKGFEAACLGALAADLDVFIGYPISPATTMLTFMQRNLIGDGKHVGQASSEIESITSILGSGYAGKRAMTSTAGPGLCLMSEGIGLAWMAEVPLVVANVQRGGPSTGLPTKTEQSDLLMALNPGHGDMRTPVIAPGTVEECFFAGAYAISWAETYQGPVILLSEASLAERQQDIPKPDASKVNLPKRVVLENKNGNTPQPRYAGEELTPFPVPGNIGAYTANGSEHDEQGDTTHLGKWHVQMTKRRFNKLKLLENDIYEFENEDSDVLIVPWGGSKGPAREAYDELIANKENVGWAYSMFVHPMPPKMLELLQSKKLVIVPELNYMGQYASYLRTMKVNAEPISQYTGLPFKKSMLVNDIKELISKELAGIS